MCHDKYTHVVHSLLQNGYNGLWFQHKERCYRLCLEERKLTCMVLCTACVDQCNDNSTGKKVAKICYIPHFFFFKKRHACRFFCSNAVLVGMWIEDAFSFLDGNCYVVSTILTNNFCSYEHSALHLQALSKYLQMTQKYI